MQIKLTNQQVLTLDQAITALDGKQDTQVVEGRPVTTIKPYKIAYIARWSLARNGEAIAKAVATFNRAKAALITEHSGGESAISPSNGNFNAFAQDYEKLAREDVELDVQQIALADLKLDENERAGNEYPIAILTALLPLIHIV